MVGRSTVLNVGAHIARVSLTVPDIADALVDGTVAAADPRQEARHDLAVRLGQGRRDLDLRGQGPARPEPAHRAHQAALPRRGHHRPRQRQGRRHLRHRLEQVRDREGRGRRRRLRREEGRRRQHAEAAGRRGVEPGHAARALRRSQPLGDAGARRVVLRQRLRRRATSGSAARAARHARADVRRRQARVQRLPEPVRLQRQGKPRRASSARCRTRVSSRAWPSRT